MIWAVAGFLAEIASQRVRLALLRQPAHPIRMRITYLLTAAAVSSVWSGLPILYWVKQETGLEAASVLILTSQLIHAQAFTYRSTPVLLVVGGIPSLMLLVVPWLGDTDSTIHFLTINLAVMLAIGYAAASVRANRQTLQTLRSAQAELEHLAYFDALTSLANRRLFSYRLRQLIERSQQLDARFALLLIDLNRFKAINDTLGHDAGDAVLVEVGARLKRAVRRADCVARLGGDEFAIILSETGESDEIRRICARIAESFTDAIDFHGRPIMAGLSIGIATFPEDGDSEERLLKSADLALYRIKGDSHRSR